MPKATNPTEQINAVTKLTECKDGFWLYDKNRGMNLAISAISEKAALIKALEYYQKRLLEVEGRNKRLNKHITTFLESLGIDEEPDI
jgi:hypothetical protein